MGMRAQSGMGNVATDWLWNWKALDMNTSGVLTPDQKQQLIDQEVADLVKAGMSRSAALAQATHDITGVLTANNADPSQLSVANTYLDVTSWSQLWDKMTGDANPPEPGPPTIGTYLMYAGLGLIAILGLNVAVGR